MPKAMGRGNRPASDPVREWSERLAAVVAAHWPRETGAMHDGSPILECECGEKWYGDRSCDIPGLRAQWVRHALAIVEA